MDIKDTPLGDEIDRIIDAQAGNANNYMEATIHTKFGDVVALKLLNYDVVRQYATQYTDEITIVLVIPKGQYAYKVIPSRNDLEITLLDTAMAQHGSIANGGKVYGVEKFRAIIKDSNDPTLEASARELLSIKTLDLMDFETISFQLFNRAMEQFSMISCGGIYRRTKIGDLVRSLLLKQFSKIAVENVYKPLGIDMVEPNDEHVREHVIIPHGLPVYDAPGYIHKHCGGVYPTGLSYYYQDDYWYVYPTFDYKRFNQATRQLNIIQIPENKLPDLTHTYLKEGSVLTILATGQLSLEDKSDIRKRNDGNGVRFADASKLFEETSEVKDNRAIISRGKLNNEFISSQQKSVFNNVVLSNNPITANTMYEASKLASKEGVFVQLIWQNANPALILPGMQTKISYFKNGRVHQISAIVVATHSSTSYEGKGLVAGRFNRNTAIMLFCANEANQ